MPHPLPEDIGSVTDTRWFLVAVPDDAAFIAAALDIYTEMANFWKWGAEGPVPVESDQAAQLWAQAVSETLEALEMGFPDVLLGHIDEVEALLQAIRDLSGCCDPQDPLDGDFYTDRVEDGTGDVPQNIIDAGYATDAADWEGFAEYKCMIAHALLDTAKWRLQELVSLVDEEASDIVGGIGAITAVIGFIIAATVTGPVGLAAGIIAAAGAAAKLYDELFDIGVTVTNQVISDLETHREEITCAIYQADGDQAAISAFYSAVDTHVGVDGGALVRPLNLGPALKALYAGRYDQQNVAQALADNGFLVSGYACCTPSAFVGKAPSLTGGIAIWDGADYQSYAYGAGVEAYEFSDGESLRVKGSAAAGDISFLLNETDADNPTSPIERDLAFDVVNPNASLVEWTLFDDTGTIIYQDDALADSGTFPIVFEGVASGRITCSLFESDNFLTTWALMEFN